MNYLAVAAGGVAGACLRFFVTEWMGTLRGFPIATVVINIVGSFFLAWFYTITLERFPVHPTIRLGIGTGLVGAFTTFSTFTVDFWKLWQSGEWLMAAGYILLSVIGGIGAALLGYATATRQSRLAVSDEAHEEA
ncbi:CrcB family protein [Alicyclobacillus tolerans]|uniref:fluoride efflux transporter FluC n=1 Tax=Alicyclobacillus tolerans TaxID=90970 RepID=UPI001F2A2CB3|nr:CrcB family protein [Alicyclobacillus tolerans]MCF8563292.1 CrcB family protein [Alicyclobacillus tolerans]